MDALQGYLLGHVLGKERVPKDKDLIDYQAKFSPDLSPQVLVDTAVGEGVTYQAITEIAGRNDLMTFEDFREKIDCLEGYRIQVDDEQAVVLQGHDGKGVVFFPSVEYHTRFEGSGSSLLSPYHEVHVLVVGGERIEEEGTKKLLGKAEMMNPHTNIAYGVAHFGAVPRQLIGFGYPTKKENIHLLELLDEFKGLGMETRNGSCSLYMSAGNDLVSMIMDGVDSLERNGLRSQFASSDAHPTTNPKLLAQMLGSVGVLISKKDLRDYEDGNDVEGYIVHEANNTNYPQVFGRPWSTGTFAKVMVPNHLRNVVQGVRKESEGVLDRVVQGALKDMRDCIPL